MTKEEIKEYNRIYRENNREKILKAKKDYRLNNPDKIKESRKKHYNKNKLHIKLKNKEYVEKNKLEINEKKRIYAVKYRIENADKIKLTRKKWKLKNPEYDKNYNKCKRLNDPIYKFKCNLRTMIYNRLKSKGYKKEYNSEQILGCTYKDFKEYIESKFNPWMNWENYGLYNGSKNYGWDIDHIIPLKTAKTEKDVIKLNHYSNLQPLCGYTNRITKR